jgi:predicted phage gp36 major capsid-like protein
MQAAIHFITQIDLVGLSVPASVLGHLQPHKHQGTSDHVLHESFISNEIQQAATAFGNALWHPRAASIQPSTEKSRIADRLKATVSK